MDLECNAKFSETGLTRDIGAQLQSKFLQLTVEESRRFAQESLERIEREGDSALYNALVKLGVDYAIAIYQEIKLH